MKNFPIVGVAVAIVASIMLLAGVLSAQSGDRPAPYGQAPGQGPALLGPQSDDQDLSGCEQDCRSRFGYDMYADPQWRRGPGGRGGSYYAYAACIAECNRKYWKAFDKEMEGLGRE
jgi:hypothetical protein